MREKRKEKKAEAGGFEPPVRLPVRQFSKLVVSATHPNFLSFYCVMHFSNALQIYGIVLEYANLCNSFLPYLWGFLHNYLGLKEKKYIIFFIRYNALVFIHIII